MMRQAKEERLHVRIPAELKAALVKAAEQSGWEISDQVRYELMRIRGMWKEPSFPMEPAKHTPSGRH